MKLYRNVGQHVFRFWIHSVMAELFPLTFKNCNQNVVYYFASKVYDEEWMLVSMNCVVVWLGFSLPICLSNDRAVAFGLVKNYHFQLEPCRAPKVFWLEL